MGRGFVHVSSYLSKFADMSARQLDVRTLFRRLSAPRPGPPSTAEHVPGLRVGGQSSDVDHDVDVSSEGAKVTELANDTAAAAATVEEDPADSPPAKRRFVAIRQQCEKRTFLGEWRTTYLMDYDSTKEQMTCMICKQLFDTLKTGPKLDTIRKHLKRKHQDLKGFDLARKRLIVRRYEADAVKEKDSLTKMLNPAFDLKAAPYKLAFVIAQKSYPCLRVRLLLSLHRVQTLVPIYLNLCHPADKPSQNASS